MRQQLSILLLLQHYYIITTVYMTILPYSAVSTGLAPGNAGLVAHAQPALGAITPDRMLHKPREYLRIGRVEGARVDLRGKAGYNYRTALAGIAGGSVRVCRSQCLGNAGPVQEIVHQRAGSFN